MSYLSKTLLRLWGWKVTGRYPFEVPKLILCAAPHTSNWDFPVGVLVRSAWGIKANFVAKHTLFRGPLGPLFRWLGGVPVDRSKPGNNFVNATVEAFKREPYMHLVIAPEGTRKKVDRFKTGIYHIAHQAGVPILLTSFNWATRTVHFDEQLFHTTGDLEHDMDFLWNYFKGIPGYHPSNSVQ